MGPLEEGSSRILEAYEEGFERRVLLVRHPDPASVARAERVAGLCVAMDVVELQGEPRSVVPYPSGRPLVGMEGEARRAAVVRVAEVLHRGQAAGVGVPGLVPEQVFVEASGQVQIVGTRGGASTVDDVVALLEAELPANRAIQAKVDEGEVESLEQLVVALGGRLASVPDPAPMPSSDRVWVSEVKPGESAAMPPKVRVALAAGLTLALGFASAWIMLPSAAEIREVRVPGASEIEVTCGDDRWSSTVETLVVGSSSTACRISASLGQQTVSGKLPRPDAGAYDCRENEGELRCVRR